MSAPTPELLDGAFLRRLEGLTLRAPRRYDGHQTGAKRALRRGAGLEFADHRAYVAGDDLRHLDWPLLGRLGRPFVKTYEQEQDLRIHLLLDASRSMAFGEPAKWLAAARLAAALAHVGLASLDRVGAALYDGRGLRPHAPARGQGAFLPLLRFLASATADGPAGGAEALKLHAASARPGLCVVLSDFLDPDFETLLRPHLLRRHSLVLIQVLAPQELDPELVGDLELRDAETGERVDVSLDARELAAYRQRLKVHRQALRRFALRYRAEVFSFSSDLGLEAAVEQLLRGAFFGQELMPDFLQPGFLWLGALTVPLVALYLLKARRRRHVQTAVWLWRAAQRELEARVPLRKLRRDWLLALQLLILALLALAAAGPYRRAVGGGDVAVVVDASASMLAADRPARLERTLGRLIDGMGSGDRVALVRAGARPEVLAPLTGDRPTLLEAATGARPAAAPAEMAAAVELAEHLVGAVGQVVVVTDPAGEVPAAGDRIQVVRVGEAGANAGIVALGVRPSDASGRDHQVFVRLRNASPEPATGTLRLSVDGGVRDAARLTLGAGREVGHTLRLVGPEAAVIEVAWRGDVDDALAADDRAYWVLSPAPERRYRLRGAAGPFLRRALEAAGGWRPASAGESADLEVVVGVAPAADGPPFLWVDPPASAVADGAAVLRWDRTHPALRFVDLRAVRLGEVPRLERPPGARVLAESTAGPLVLEGSHRQRRYLLWAFDPLDTDLPLRVAWPLLVRHALEHLAPAGGPIDGGVATGPALAAAPVAWPASGGADSAAAVTLTSPAGHEVVLTPAAGVVRLPPLEEIGVWRLAGGGRELRFAASLLDAAESDLGSKPDAGGAASAGGPVTVERANPRGLWRPLIAAALLLLLLEAAAFHRRWTL